MYEIGVPPTGQQHTLRRGDHEVIVAEVGASIRRYTTAGVDVIDGYGVAEMASSRGCPLIPWPNRLSHGQYTWDGERHQLPINEPAKSNALHGLTRFMSWMAHRTAADDVTMSLRLYGQEGYPFVLDLTMRYELGEHGLSVTAAARNVGAAAAPFGFGAHPYITVGTSVVDDAVLHVPADTYLATDDRGIPVGRHGVDGTAFDFRAARRIGSVKVDHAFTDLDRAPDGTVSVTLGTLDGKRHVIVWADEHLPYLQVFTGDALPHKSRRRRGLGVEPMTCPPNAFDSGEHVIRLEPGDEFEAQWGIKPDAP